MLELWALQKTSARGLGAAGQQSSRFAGQKVSSISAGLEASRLAGLVVEEGVVDGGWWMENGGWRISPPHSSTLDAQERSADYKKTPT